MSVFNDEKTRCKCYSEQIITRDNGHVQSHAQEENKLNSSIIVNSGAHTLKDGKITRMSIQ